MRLNVYTPTTEFESFEFGELKDIKKIITEYCEKNKVTKCKFSIRATAEIPQFKELKRFGVTLS